MTNNFEIINHNEIKKRIVAHFLKFSFLAIQKSPIKKRSRRRTLSKEMPNQAGATLENQWPEIESVYISTQTMIEQLQANSVALVSEKLDGSNLSVSSEGKISTRRKIILTKPSSKKLKETKFAGESLATLEPVMTCVKNLAENWQQKIGAKFELTIFGEWIQCGTASSKEDKFSYEKRGLLRGHLYTFGLGLVFDKGLEKAKKYLNSKGFSVSVQSEKFLILILNPELKKLFDQNMILTVPILSTLPFVQVFKKMSADLLQHKVEGFIITIPCKNLILKWKGYEDSDPRRIENFIEITAKCKIAEAIGPLNKVLQESILFHAQGRKRFLDKAFVSARSKFPRLDDILSDYSDDEKAKIIQGYKFNLVQEITKDFAKAFGCTQESIEAFVNQEVKHK